VPVSREKKLGRGVFLWWHLNVEQLLAALHHRVTIRPAYWSTIREANGTGVWQEEHRKCCASTSTIDCIPPCKLRRGRPTGLAFENDALNRPRFEAACMEVIDLGFADFERTLYLIWRDHYTAYSARGAAPASPEKRAASFAQRQRTSLQPLAGLCAEGFVSHGEREYAAPSSLVQCDG
jgi:hypothetical protein